MSTFRVSAAGLLRLATEGSLADRVAEHVWMSGHGVSPAERRAWSRSLSMLAQDLADAGLAAKESVGETARMTAGYCWPWSDPRPDGTLVNDVQLGGWSRPWNVKSDRRVGDAPGCPFWATDPDGFGQVGCVYTAQGFEYDWSGVIIGPDLVARNGWLVTDRDEFKDPNFRSRKTVSDAEADRLIRNTYKVLMTRGMRGTILYAADPETRAFLAGLIPVHGSLENA
jgi:DUF2075 family protein